MVNTMVTGPGVSAPYSKFPTPISPPPGIIPPQLTQGDYPPSHSMSKKSSEGPHDEPLSDALIDIDYQMDGIDDDADSFGSDFGSLEDDPPEYLYPSLEEEAEVIPKPTALFSSRSGSEAGKVGVDTTIQSSRTGSLSINNCIICQRFKPSKDISTCGDRRCDQELKAWQGLGSSHTSPGPSSNNHCPVCNNVKLSADTTCGKEFCLQRLRFWEGLPSIDRGLSSSNNRDLSSNDPQPSFSSNGRPGPSSYSAALQTRRQTRAGGHMCEVCHQRPRYNHNGKTYPTCGLTCAAKLNPSGRVEMCDLCHQRPKVVLNGRVYPHCGRTCRDKARSAEPNNVGTGTCTTCLNCWKAPANLRKDEFCSDSCRDTIEHRAPLLLEIPRGHSSFNDVEKEFRSAWTQRKAPCPSIKKIYMVCIPARREANFEDYGKKVSLTYGIIPGGLLGRKKEEFRWIPGLRDCPLGHPGMTTPCQFPHCQLCNVLRGTYVPENFGKGISTMSLPRATHDYDRWAATQLRYRISKVVLLSKVFFGRVAESDTFHTRTGPPQGANSVRVVSYVHHSRVETDEILVYSCEALRPVYLISYE